MALTISQIQANITDKDDLREIVNQLADYLEANQSAPGEGEVGYLVYTALLTQSGTDAPTAEALGAPTITGVTFGYDGSGNYYVASDAFVENKTWWNFQPGGGYNSAVAHVRAEIVFNEAGYPSKMIYFVTTNAGNNAVDDWGAPLPIEIRVYP